MFMNPMMSQHMTPEMMEALKSRTFANMGARMMMAGGQGKGMGEALGTSVLGGMSDADSMMKAGLSTQMQGMQMNKMKQEAEMSSEYMNMLSGMDTPKGNLGPLAMASARMGNPTMLANVLNPSTIQQGKAGGYPYLFSQDAMGGQSGPSWMPQPTTASMFANLMGGEGGGTGPAAPAAPPPPATLSSSIQQADTADVATKARLKTEQAMGKKMDRLTKNLDKAGMQWAGGEWMQVKPGFPDISEKEAKRMYGEFNQDFSLYGPNDQSVVTNLMRQLKTKYGF